MQISPNHLFLNSASTIQEICRPLLQLGIDHFSFTRNYPSGTRIYLSTHQDLLQNYFAKQFYLIGSCESKPEAYDAQYYLWTTLPQKKMYEDARRRGIPEGIFITEPNKNLYTDFFNFATSDPKKNITNIYLTNFHRLNQFISYFKDQAQDLILKAKKLNFTLPCQYRISTTMPNSPKLSLHVAEKNLNLSKQQYECAIRLVNGASLKEIATNLRLSPRTVETYVENLKNKLRTPNKTTLILKLHDMLKS